MQVIETVNLGLVEVDYTQLSETVKKIRKLPMFAEMSPKFADHYPHANKDMKRSVELELIKFAKTPQTILIANNELDTIGYRPGSIHEFLAVPQFYGTKFSGHVIGSGANTTNLRYGNNVVPVITGEYKTDFCVFFLERTSSNWNNLKEAYYLAIRQNA